jgi:glycosyltransferase involved in cell wall biosynthesis
VRILFVDTANEGTVYYRMRMFMEPLKARGHQVAMMDWLPGRIYSAGWQGAPESPHIARRLGMLVASSDVVITQICQHPRAFNILAECCSHFNRPMLTDIDDNVLGVQPDNPAFIDFHNSHPRLELVKHQLTVSHGLITPSDFLAELYAPFNPDIYLVPNAVDPEKWPEPPHKTPTTPIVGWQGSASHGRDLATIRPTIEKLAKETPAKLVFIGGVPDWVKELPKITYDPDYELVEKWPAKLVKFNIDIGLAPLADNAFSRGKSDLRFLEYSAAGIATVAQDARPYQTVQDGTTGLLYRNAEELESILKVMIYDPARIDVFKEQARKWVMENRTADHSAAIYEAALEGYCG